MPDVDSLAFNIRFALTHKTGGATKKLIRSLPEDDLERLAQIVADHLRRCRWRQLPPEPPMTSAQYPRVRHE